MSPRGYTHRISSEKAEVAATDFLSFVVAVDGYAVIQDREHGKSSYLAFAARSLAEKALRDLPYSISRDAEIVEVDR